MGFRRLVFFAMSLGLLVCATSGRAQVGNSGSIEGVVKDPSGAAVVNVTVEIKDPVSGYERTTTTSNEGAFRFTNVPFNGYHLSVNANGFAPFAQDVEVRSMVPTRIEVDVKIVTSATTVTVESGGDLTENDPTFHTDVDRNDFRAPAAGKRIVLCEFTSNSGDAGSCRRFQRAFPRTR